MIVFLQIRANTIYLLCYLFITLVARRHGQDTDFTGCHFETEDVENNATAPNLMPCHRFGFNETVNTPFKKTHTHMENGWHVVV